MATTDIGQLVDRVLRCGASTQAGGGVDATEQQRELQAALGAALLAAIPPQQPPSPHAGSSSSSGGGSDTAAAWTAAAPALASMYAWDEQAVVRGVIAFWQQVAALLAAKAATPGQPDSDQQRFIAWLWRVSPEGVAAIIEAMHAFWRLTGVSHLAHMQQQQQSHAATHVHLLLLFLELTASSSARSAQLLQLSSSSSRRAPAETAAAMTASEAFAGTCLLLQASAGATLPAQQLQQLVARAGAFLRDGFGWCDFSSAAYASAADAAAAGASAQAAHSALADGSSSPSTRPPSLHSLYDCFIQQLASELLRGPQRQAGGELLVPAAAAEPDDDNEDAWEDWLATDGFKSLASLLVSYDRPQALVRGLAVLAQEQLLQERQTAAATATGKATQPTQQPPPAGASQRTTQKEAAAAKAAMQRVMRLLECVFLAAAEEPGAGGACFHAAAFGVRQLLLGLAELLRPSANCSVEWRVAALGLMRAALEQHAERQEAEQPDVDVWSDASAEGLLFCLAHDPSIQARRAAASLLQHVVVPASSPTARALVRCLAAKLQDKDQGGVAPTALQLFVQLDASLVAASLTPTEWCAAVQAGLGLVSGSQLQEGGDKAATVRQFTGLLKAVLDNRP